MLHPHSVDSCASWEILQDSVELGMLAILSIHGVSLPRHGSFEYWPIRGDFARASGHNWPRQAWSQRSSDQVELSQSHLLEPALKPPDKYSICANSCRGLGDDL